MKQALNEKADGTHAYAIVLGAKVNADGPSLSLQYRLEAAFEYANRYSEVQLILSGGQGPDEPMSEAEAMRRYLLERGLDEHRLLVESASTTTYENLRYAKSLLPEDIQAVTIITSDYHVARARMLAKNLGLQSDVVAAKTPEIVKARLVMRERIALIKTYLFGK